MATLDKLRLLARRCILQRKFHCITIRCMCQLTVRNEGCVINSDEVTDTEQKPTDRISPYLKVESRDDFEHRLKEIEWDMNAIIAKSRQEAELFVIEKYFQEKANKDGTLVAKSNTIKEYRFVFGSPDPNEPTKNIPCGGCGSNLHCNDPGLPGYVASEKYKSSTNAELKQLKCSRCSLMEEYNVMLEVKASDIEFYNIISRIRSERALILLIVDLTDIENSIMKNLFEYIQYSRPLYVVGNKVDLMPNDGPGYLQRLEMGLRKACLKHGLNPTGRNIKHVSLVSGKTGYGIEDLITKLLVHWEQLGNVYMIGNTNCGKSTLFNTLLQSDYCRSSVREVIQNATVSQWPGTTINLLKFPILSPSAMKLNKRKQRLRKEKVEHAEEMKLEQSRKRNKDSIKEAVRLATLSASVGMTDFWDKEEARQEKDYQGMATSGFNYHSREGKFQITEQQRYIYDEREKIDFDDKTFSNPKYFFDTPGVIDDRQLINRLTPEELSVVLNKELIIPRVYLFKPDYTMFIAGLGRLDFIQGNQNVFIVVHMKLSLPVAVLPSAYADQYYSDNIGTDVMKAPLGDSNRLIKLPSLVGKEFHVTSKERDIAVGDIQLSSLGWVSVMACSQRDDLDVALRAYTPGGHGMYMRTPSLFPNAHVFHTRKKPNSYLYKTRLPTLAKEKKVELRKASNRIKGTSKMTDIEEQCDSVRPIKKLHPNDIGKRLLSSNISVSRQRPQHNEKSGDISRMDTKDFIEERLKKLSKDRYSDKDDNSIESRLLSD